MNLDAQLVKSQLENEVSRLEAKIDRLARLMIPPRPHDWRADRCDHRLRLFRTKENRLAEECIWCGWAMPVGEKQ